MKQPGCKILSDMDRVSSAGRSWDHSCWDHHPTHPAELPAWPGWLGSQERPRLAVTSASEPPACSSVPLRLRCWAVPLCTGRKASLPCQPRAGCHSAASVPWSPRQSWGPAPVPQCSPLQPELPHGYGRWGQERVKLSAL